MSRLLDASEIRELAAGVERHQRCPELARMAFAWRDHMVRAVRNYPRLDAWLKRKLGKSLSHEEN